MRKISKMLAVARNEALLIAAKDSKKELLEAIERMSTDQLQEIVSGELTDERLKEIFDSVGALHLLEGDNNHDTA